MANMACDDIMMPKFSLKHTYLLRYSLSCLARCLNAGDRAKGI